MKKGAVRPARAGGATASYRTGGQKIALEPGVAQATCYPGGSELVNMETQTPGQSQAVTLQATSGEAS